jgi:hypothetical protein
MNEMAVCDVAWELRSVEKKNFVTFAGEKRRNWRAAASCADDDGVKISVHCGAPFLEPRERSGRKNAPFLSR